MAHEPLEAAPEPRAGSVQRTSAVQWAAEPERGSALLLTLMVFVALRLGRPLARLLLRGIAAYFFVFAPRARRHARAYLQRVLRREPTARDRYRQVFTFAATILDRLYLTRGRYELFEISIEGEELMRGALERGKGAFLLGAHLGSFELMSAVGRRQPGLHVALAMYTQYASRVGALLGNGPPASAPEIIPLGQLESMLRIRDCLDEGKFVGMLADRTFDDAPDRLEKRTLEPRPEDLVLEHGMLSVERDHHRHSVSLHDFPQAVPYVESLRATLAGDRAALARYFTVQFSGTLGSWTLALTPADAVLKRSVQHILITGERDRIRTVQIRQSDGDTSTLTIGGEVGP